MRIKLTGNKQNSRLIRIALCPPWYFPAGPDRLLKIRVENRAAGQTCGSEQCHWGRNVFTSYISSATNSVYPLVFSFACKTGNFAYEYNRSIGEHWLRIQNGGGIVYFGSSVTTLLNSDVAIEKKIFGNAFTENEHISGIINLGMLRYAQRLWSKWNKKRTNRYLKAYNLLGDPSLNILGTGCISDYIFDYNEVFYNGDIISYHAINNIQNNNSFLVKNGSQVTLRAGNNILLKSGFKVELGGAFKAEIETCND
ncbi:MAG: C25 family cysteine peptidase [Bacteroidota bacterium]|nr:C25 family cysteine peptidase [Bacteroidota bacterium]